MAVGDLLGAFTNSANSATNPFSATGSVAVVVGDLVVAIICEQTSLTATAFADNLGNTYLAVNAGTDAGTVTGRLFYSRVTNAGTLTSVDCTMTASGNDVALVVGIFQGPFASSPLDAAPANNSNTDNSSPFTCPSSGTLAQATESVIAWMVGQGTSAVWSATSPNLKAGQVGGNSSNTILGYQTVSATTAVAPAFTGTNPTVSAQGTASFKHQVDSGRSRAYLSG